MAEILLAEDSADTLELVRLALGEQHRLTCVSTAAAVFEHLAGKRYDLVVLDVSLPDGDGFQVCARLRHSLTTRQVPIVFLSGRTGVANRVTGLSLGADDYVEKPFDPMELSLRVNALLERRSLGEELQIGELKLNFETQAVEVDKRAVTLTAIEFKMLSHLMRQEGRVLSREQLLNLVWGRSTFVIDRTVDKHICALRKKLCACGPMLQTVPGFGYKLARVA